MNGPLARLVVLLLLAAGCSVVSLDLTPRVRPLEETTLEGTGRDKVLLLDLSGVLAEEPIFTLEGTEGRLFKPLAFTKTYAMGFAAVLSVTLTPALAALFIRGRIRGEHANPVNRWLVHAYAPIVRAVVRRRRLVIGGAVVVVLSAIPPFLQLGSEFMPPLNEGTLLAMPTAPPACGPRRSSH